jgi:hypothetical protein
MLVKISGFIILLFLVGCMSTGIKTYKDGQLECEANYQSFSRNVDGTDIHACGGGGSSTSSSVDVEALISILNLLKAPK